MKYGVIDIGSNSCRLMISEDGKTLEKIATTTRLGNKLAQTGMLQKENMELSCTTIINFVKYAMVVHKVDETMCFATEAVRSASNRAEFVKMLADNNIALDIIPSAIEAQIGFAGAYTSGDCCVIDIGGASTEIAIGNDKGISFGQSVQIGLVRVKDNCGEDPQLIQQYVDKQLALYGEFTHYDKVLGIGGTVTSLVAMAEGLEPYDPQFVDGYCLKKSVVEKWLHIVAPKTMEERSAIKGLKPQRRDVIVGGCYLLMGLMDKLKVEEVIVRESDNLEGYLMYKTGKFNIK